MTNNTIKIIERLGGQSAVARHLNISKQAVDQWIRVGYVPEKWHMALLELADNSGAVVALADFYADDRGARTPAGQILNQARDALQTALDAVDKLRGMV